jgi:hypothetical protein
MLRIPHCLDNRLTYSGEAGSHQHYYYYYYYYKIQMKHLSIAGRGNRRSQSPQHPPPIQSIPAVRSPVFPLDRRMKLAIHLSLLKKSLLCGVMPPLTPTLSLRRDNGSSLLHHTEYLGPTARGSGHDTASPQLPSTPKHMVAPYYTT